MTDKTDKTVAGTLDLEGAVQVIESDGEPTFAIVPWKDWTLIRAALTDQSDAALIRLSRVRIAGGEETIPGEVIHAIHIDGDTPLAAFRKWRGLKQVELADYAGLKQAYVSELEAGKKTPSLDALQALAAVLEVDLGLLIAPRNGAEQTPEPPKPALKGAVPRAKAANPHIRTKLKRRKSG